MSDNRGERITFRLDPQTGGALERFLEATKRKKSDVVHEALHRYLLDHDPEYRVAVLGKAAGEPALTENPALRGDEPTTGSDFPDVGIALPGQSCPDEGKSGAA